MMSKTGEEKKWQVANLQVMACSLDVSAGI